VDLAGSLHTLCQIGVALLGFGGMATAIGSRATERRQNAFLSLHGALLAGFVLAVGGALPPVFSQFGLEPATALRFAAGVLFVTNVAVTYYAMRLRPAVPVDSFAKFFFFPAELTGHFGLLVVASGFFPTAAPGLYVLFLTLFLLEGGIAFLIFFHGVFGTETSADDPKFDAGDNSAGSPAAQQGAAADRAKARSN